jgi:hypothetical protein
VSSKGLKSRQRLPMLRAQTAECPLGFGDRTPRLLTIKVDAAALRAAELSRNFPADTDGGEDS